MVLECTLVRGPASGTPSPPEELTIGVPFGTPGARVLSLLQEARQTERVVVGGQDLATLTVGSPPLVAGAVLVDGPTSQPLQDDSPLPLLLVCHSGPNAGAVFPLERGRYRMGRGPADISIPDPGMSRDHAVLEVSRESLTLNDVRGSNPVFVDDQRIRHAALTSSSTLRCGNSTFSVVTDRGVLPALSMDAGRSVEEPIEVAHSKNSGNRLTMGVAAGLPLIAGIGLAVATGMWMYLGFTVISAISLLVPFISSRKGRKDCKAAVARAVQQDIQRRHRCAPSAATIALATREGAAATGWYAPDAVPGTPVSAGAPGNDAQSPDTIPGAWVRLGTMKSLANVRLVPDEPQFVPPPIGFAALTLDPRHPAVTLRGKPAHVDSVLRFLLMQHTSYPVSAGAPVIILGRLERLPLSARFLPRVTLAADPIAALAALRHSNGSPSGRLIMLDNPAVLKADAVSSLLDAARLAAWQVVQCDAPVEHAGPVVDTHGPVIEIAQSGTTGCLQSGGQRLHFTPDLVAEDVFDRFCRSAAGAPHEEGPGNGDGLPDQCSLYDLLPYGTRRILRRWGGRSLQDGLSAVLGKSKQGMLHFDFKRDGPHLLVAGTTGSGKSELLRTLVASMALSDAPDRTTFLFFDFKGGSGLGPLADLPHCVGILTDLGKHHLNRTLASLRAEISLREKLFAAAGASDLSQYRQSGSCLEQPIANLVLVIDEFRMLVDEAPGALRELMRVATIGRSLGIHLVMATQRPQGALTADIRANVTSSIALRVQSETESVDIINSKVAASIDVDAPGRAYLAKASSPPEEFQTASLAEMLEAGATDGQDGANDFLLVQTATQALLRPPNDQSRTSSHEATSCEGAERIVSSINDAWRRLDGTLPRPPVAAPLPTSISWHDELPVPGASPGLPSHEDSRWAVGPIALLDKPNHQVVEPLLWLPSIHGHLAMIGSVSGGMQECFRAVAALLATSGPKPHLYILDASGVLGNIVESGHIGATADLNHVPLAVRVLRRLATEMEHRRATKNDECSRSPLVLVVTGWCSWAAALRAGPYGFAEGVLQDIVRDGGPLGITVLISGERELVSSRFFAAIQNRAYFPSGTTEESRFHWPRMPELESIPGRAVVMGNVVDGQSTVAHFREAPSSEEWPYSHFESREPPFRVRPLPHLLSGDDFHALLKASRGRSMMTELRGQPSDDDTADSQDSQTLQGNAQCPLWIGVGGDECLPLAIPLRARGVSIIIGSQGSGKSSVLGTLQNLNPLVPWVSPALATPRGSFWASVAREAATGALDPNSILLVDDADSLDGEGRQALSALAGTVRGIIMTATSTPTLMHHLPLAREVQLSGTGLILAPRSSLDGEPLGVRVEVDPTARAGRGFVVHGQEVNPFQAVLTTDFPLHVP